MKTPCIVIAAALAVSCGEAVQTAAPDCDAAFIILGAGQDAGAPQIGYKNDAAWTAPEHRLLATSAALVDKKTGARYLFEATPDISEQLHALDLAAPHGDGPLGLDGVFLTHAHIGHYAGLMFFGREAAGTDALPVYAMERMTRFLRNNGPWEQLVSLGNIDLRTMTADEAAALPGGLSVTPLQVPHRDEYSETVGYVIEGPDKSALFLPDIDSWREWATTYEHAIEDVLAQVDYAFVDATFYSDDELPNRDMSKIPHPRVADSMDHFDAINPETRAKVYFIHINHTNPIRFADSQEAGEVRSRGYHIARRGDRVCL